MVQGIRNNPDRIVARARCAINSIELSLVMEAAVRKLIEMSVLPKLTKTVHVMQELVNEL